MSDLQRKVIQAPAVKSFIECEDGTLLDEDEVKETIATVKAVIDLARLTLA